MEMIDKRYEEGCLDIETGRLDKASEIFLVLINENPKNYYAINKLGVIYANKNELDRAEECFIKALEIEKYYAPALVNLGNISREYGDLDEAEKYYKTSIEYEPEYYLAYHNLSILYKSKGQFDKYMKYIKEYKRTYKRYVKDQTMLSGKNIRAKALKSTRFLYVIGLVFFIFILVKTLF